MSDDDLLYRLAREALANDEATPDDLRRRVEAAIESHKQQQEEEANEEGSDDT